MRSDIDMYQSYRIFVKGEYAIIAVPIPYKKVTKKSVWNARKYGFRWIAEETGEIISPSVVDEWELIT